MVEDLEPRPTSSGRGLLWWAVLIYAVSLAIPLPGIMGFLMALYMLLASLMSPLHCDLGSWVIGLSWLANPLIWYAMISLAVGKWQRAMIAGEVAILLATFVIGMGFRMPAYYLWIASMAVVVWGSLRVGTHGGARWPRPLITCLILSPPLFLGPPLVWLYLQGAYSLTVLDDRDANAQVATGFRAKGRVFFDGTGSLPASAANFWCFEGGNFNGSYFYSTFECANNEDCLKAVDGLGLKDFKPWEPSKYAVVMEGPEFYTKGLRPWNRLRSNPWDVRGIKHGLVYELVTGGHDRMVYFAIDLDRNRVYYHYESGGFPPDVYRPDATTR